MCLPNNHSIKGTLQHYSLDYNVAVVNIGDFYCRHIAEYKAELQVKPYMEVVVAIGRVFKTGKLMATNGVVTPENPNSIPIFRSQLVNLLMYAFFFYGGT